LRRVRQKLGDEGDEAFYVRMKRSGNVLKKEVVAGEKKEGEEEEADLDLEGWLTAWEEVPDGCCVIAGAVKENWDGWGIIRSAVF
jgi:hypothetical protein